MRYATFPVFFLGVVACSSVNHGTPVDAQSPQDLVPADDRAPADGCQLYYPSPGCGANTPQPHCVSMPLACLQHACSCDGHVITGCYDFRVPYAYATFSFLSSGDTCDPNLDAGGAPDAPIP
jgi:hypothetical protein